MATVIEPYVARVAPVQPSAPRIQLDTSIGDALQRVGSEVSQFGARAAAQKKQRDAQNAQLGLVALNEQASQKLIEIQREAPANGADITKTFEEKFLLPETTKFLETVPPELKEEYQQRLKIFSDTHRNNASNTEYTQGNTFSQTVVGQNSEMAKRGIAENPVKMKAFVDDFNAAVDVQPNLTTAQREKFKADFAQAAPAMLAETLKTQDPETLVAMLGGKNKTELVKYIMPHLADAVYFAETSSGANVKTSKAGAMGAMQVMPETALEVATKLGDAEFVNATGKDRAHMLKSDYYSMRYGTEYLRQGLELYGGDIELALIRYNAGAGRVDEFLKNSRQWNANLGKWAEETGPYVAKIFGRMGTKGLAGKPMIAKTTGSELTGVTLPVKFEDRSALGRMPIQTEGLSKDVINKWEHVQGSFGRQVPIISATRPVIVVDGKEVDTNKEAKGADKSQHKLGNAIDVDVTGMSKEERIRLIKLGSAAGYGGVGVYPNSLHFDIGSRRYWGPNFHGDSLPEWAQGVIADHMAGGYASATDLSKAAPAPSTGAGSGEGGAPRGVAAPPAPTYQGPVSADLAGMSGTALLSIRSEAITANKVKTEEQKQAEANTKTALIATGKADSDSILTSGQPILKPEEVSDFETNLLRSGGLDEVNKWRNARHVNGVVYEATKNLGKMTVNQISGLIDIVKPTGGTDAGVQLEIEKAVVEKATKELEKRGKDPAGYVQGDPDVQAAIGRINKDDITTTERYFDAVKMAQSDIGLPFTPLSVDDAKKASAFIAKTFIEAELAGASSQDAAIQILKVFEETYGGYADDVYVQALSATMDERISKDTKQVLSDSFVEWIKANPSVMNPKNTIRERINYFQELGEIEKATAPLAEPSSTQSWMRYLGMKGMELSPAGVAKTAVKAGEAATDIWQTIGKPAAKGIGEAIERLPEGKGEVQPGVVGAGEAAPVPSFLGVPGVVAPSPTDAPKRPPEMQFTIPGVRDYDLDALGTNADDKQLQENFRFEYGGELLDEALKQFKQRAPKK